MAPISFLIGKLSNCRSKSLIGGCSVNIRGSLVLISVSKAAYKWEMEGVVGHKKVHLLSKP